MKLRQKRKKNHIINFTFQTLAMVTYGQHGNVVFIVCGPCGYQLHGVRMYVKVCSAGAPP